MAAIEMMGGFDLRRAASLAARGKRVRQASPKYGEPAGFYGIRGRRQSPDGWLAVSVIAPRRWVKALRALDRRAGGDPLSEPVAHRRAVRRRRLAERRLARVLRIVRDRRLTVPADGENPKNYSVRDARGGLTLIGGAWFHDFGRKRWHVAAAYLAGCDEGEEWAIRVPSTTETVADALAWTWGAVACREMGNGLPYRRQGDVLFTARLVRGAPDAEVQAERLTAALDGTRHTVAVHGGGGLIARHEGHHGAVRLPLVHGGKRLTWRATVGRQDVGLRGGRKGCGD